MAITARTWRLNTAGLRVATELVRREVAVIVATGGISSAKAAKAATTTIPIVFLTAEDPVMSRSHAASERVAPRRSVRSAVDDPREAASDCSVRLDNALI